jgi:hypothetical protein
MENFDQIKRYLLNQLSEDERKQFEEEARQNKALARELELQRFELETLDQLEEDTLKKKAVELRFNINRTGPKTKARKIGTLRSRSKVIGLLLAAASIALLIGFFFWQGSTSSEDLVTMSYEQARVDYTLNGDTRRGESTAVFDKQILDILNKRNRRQARRAIDYFSQFEAANQYAGIRAKLNLAHAYLLNQDFTIAAEVFEVAGQIPGVSAMQSEEASFFRGIALIEAGQEESGLNILETLSREGNNYDVLSRSLLDSVQ